MRAHLVLVMMILGIGCVRESAPSLLPEIPLIEVVKSLDLGDIDRTNSAPYSTSTQIRNLGSATLVINEILVSCACSGASLSRNEIPPNEESELTVGIKELGIGPKIVQISLSSNDPLNPISRIELKWN